MAAPKGNKYAVGNKGGRPKFVIDYEQAEKLAGIQCTQAEIASVLGCTVKTLVADKKFVEIYKNGMESGKASLRREQWRQAEDGNTTMLVWLGKQYLGQKDKSEQKVNQNINIGTVSDEALEEIIGETE